MGGKRFQTEQLKSEGSQGKEMLGKEEQGTHLEPADGHEAELAALAGVGVIVRQGNT